MKGRKRTHLSPETERGQDGSGGHVDVHAILLLVQLKIAQLVHGERLERGVEERDRVQPLEHLRYRLAVDEQARKQQTVSFPNQSVIILR